MPPMRRCRNCGGVVDRWAIVCPYCASGLVRVDWMRGRPRPFIALAAIVLGALLLGWILIGALFQRS
jgi:hypothetical protein